MKTATWAAAMMMAAAGPAAGAGHVIACVEMPPGDFARARMMTAAIFAAIGVNLEWRSPRRCPAEALRITLSTSTPEETCPGAMAYAMPFEGTHIVVLMDRIEARVSRRRMTVLLAHVMAHEITHMLQGCDHHSDSGLMKARWSSRDYDGMAWKPLPFTPNDVFLIRTGMARWGGGLADGDSHSVAGLAAFPQ